MIERLDTNALTRLLDGLREAVWFREPGGRMIFVSAAFDQLMGVPRSELMEDPRAHLRHVVPEHRGRVLAAGEAAAEARTTVEFEVRIPDHAPKWVRVRVGPLHDDSGQTVAVAGVGSDITHEVQAREWRERLLEVESEREEAREGEAGLRSILDRITDGFFALDRNWRFLYVNRRFEELMNVQHDEIVGEELFHRYPETRGSVFEEMYTRAMAEDRTVTFEAYWEPLSRWFEVHAYPAAEEGLSVFVQDVTERRELERALMEATAQERQRVGAELHDSVGQKLTGAALLTRAMQVRLDAGQSIEGEELATIGAVLEGLIAETRRISRGLFPVELEGESFAAALDSLAAEVEELFGVYCRVQASPRMTFSSETELHLFRIAQELITNAVKHGGARHLSLRLGCTRRGVELTVEHDGDFGDGGDNGQNGIGLRSLRYRARAIDASLHAGPVGGGGTTRTVCRLPL